MTTMYLYGQVHRESLVYGLILFCTNLCQVLQQLREDCSVLMMMLWALVRLFVCLFVDEGIIP